MLIPFPSSSLPDNLLMSLLSAEDRQAIDPHLEKVRVGRKQIICERNEAAPHIYFPTSCVLSVLAIMRNGAAVEVGIIGNEGCSGVDTALGSAVATESILCQVPGDGLRMATPKFRELIKDDTPFRRVIQRYLLAYLSQVSQTVACNRFHSIEQRFARWLLLTRDRVLSDEFPITQEFLADMLGVHRPSVSLVASAFQEAGLIRYSRGNMKILKREGLEDVTCECYDAVKVQFARVLGIDRG